MRRLTEKVWHVWYVPLLQATCKSDRCREYGNGKNQIPLLNDQDHLSGERSRFLVRGRSGVGKLDWSQQRSITSQQPAPPEKHA